MHVTNFIYLTKRLHNAGFGEELNEILKTRLQDQPSSFELPYKACFNRQVLDITIYVKKWKEQDIHHVNMYYIHKYHASLSRENTVELVEQDFYFGNYSPSVTIQEAYNLLCGRPVYKINLANKQNFSFKAWVQLDFTQTDSKGNFKWHYFHEAYGYDLAAELNKYPILNLTMPGATEHLLSALQHGYREEVTMRVNGDEHRFYIEALPRYKSLFIYDTAENPLPRAEMVALMAAVPLTPPAATITAVDADSEEETVLAGVIEPPSTTKNRRNAIK
jgi:hypothetical protein